MDASEFFASSSFLRLHTYHCVDYYIGCVLCEYVSVAVHDMSVQILFGWSSCLICLVSGPFSRRHPTATMAYCINILVILMCMIFNFSHHSYILVLQSLNSWDVFAPNPPPFLLSPFRIQNWTCCHRTLLSNLHSRKDIPRGVPGFATDCPCGFRYHEWTTYMYVGPIFRNLILNDSWFVSSAQQKTLFDFC